jgi:hypothetical protein
MKYKEGQRVRVTKNVCWQDEENNRAGKIETIAEYYPQNPPYIWKSKSGVCYSEEQLELVETNQEQPKMKEVNKMADFKVGDRVKVTQDHDHAKEGMIGEIVALNSVNHAGIKFDRKFAGGHSLDGSVETGYGHWVPKSKLELISSAQKTMAKTLTTQQEKHLDEDSKALVKVGVLYSDLSLGSQTKAIEMLIELNRKKLAEAAREELAAEEAKK